MAGQCRVTSIWPIALALLLLVPSCFSTAAGASVLHVSAHNPFGDGTVPRDSVRVAQVADLSTGRPDALHPSEGAGVLVKRDPAALNGYAFSFNGQSDVLVTREHTPYPGPDAFSIQLQFRAARAGGVLLAFTQNEDDPAGVEGRTLFLKDSGQLVFGLWPRPRDAAQPAPVHIESAQNLADGEWHHVIATVGAAGSAEGARLYVDGALVASTTANSKEETGGYWRIGGAPLSQWGPRPDATAFEGEISFLRISNAALTPAQVAALTPASVPGRTGAGAGVHPFDALVFIVALALGASLAGGTIVAMRRRRSIAPPEGSGGKTPGNGALAPATHEVVQFVDGSGARKAEGAVPEAHAAMPPQVLSRPIWERIIIELQGSSQIKSDAPFVDSRYTQKELAERTGISVKRVSEFPKLLNATADRKLDSYGIDWGAHRGRIAPPILVEARRGAVLGMQGAWVYYRLTEWGERLALAVAARTEPRDGDLDPNDRDESSGAASA